MTDPELPAPMDWISPEEVEQCEQALAAAMLATSTPRWCAENRCSGSSRTADLILVHSRPGPS
jgi:hypothetical protein